jgi:hypothetical protein
MVRWLKAGLILTFFLELGVHATVTAQKSSGPVKWDDAKIGLKIKAFGFDWTKVDDYLLVYGHQPIGDQPLTAFSFPLEFSFMIGDRKLPVGFVMDFTTAGTFSRRPSSKDYTRIRADVLSYGLYSKLNFYRRFFIRGYLLYSIDYIKILSFNEINTTNFSFQGAEFSTQASGVAGQFQLGHESKNKRFQYGIEVSYQYLVSQNDWTITPGILSDMPNLGSSSMNLGGGVFFYLKIY